MGSLFGGGEEQKPFVPKGFTSGGLRVDVSEEGITNVSRTGAMRDLLNRLKGASELQVRELGEVRSRLKPGFGALTQTAVQSIRNRRRQAIGNLRENLSRRRVLGSSFAQDVLTRGEAEFSEQEARLRAETTLKETELDLALIQEQAGVRRGFFNTLLAQSNFESNIGANVQTGVNSALDATARFEAQLAQDEAAGKGRALGTIIGAIIGAYFGRTPQATAAGAAVGGAAGEKL